MEIVCLRLCRNMSRKQKRVLLRQTNKNIMEVFISPGFAHVGSAIFQYLDNKSLCQSRLVCSSWAWFIVSERFWHRRIIQRGEKSQFCQSDEWRRVFDSFGDSNKDLSEIIQHFFTYVLGHDDEV